MATIKEMLEKSNGFIETAETMAKFLIDDNGDQYLQDLQLLYALQGKIKESKEISDRMEKIFPNDDRVLYNKGWHKMLEGDLLEGFTLMNRGRNVKLWGNAPLRTTKPIWDGESDIKGKHIIFNNEAGFGDEIIFVRFAKELYNKGAKVTVLCSPDLVSLFSRIPEISAVANYGSEQFIYHDYWIPSMLAPVLLKTQFEDLSGKPYLTADDRYVDKFKKYINSDKLKIGIRWLGQSGDDYMNRIFDEQLMFDVVAKDNIQVYSLQKDHSEDELPKEIIDLEPLLDSWEDTVGAISHLDLVVSSCTSIPHIAAALGVPTWVVIPAMPYYIWTWHCPESETTPWWDSVRLFRQRKYGNWDEPFQEIKKALKGI